MEFKDGDRVHVTRYCYENVDFYATLYKIQKDQWESDHFKMVNCSNGKYEGYSILKPNQGSYGLNESDYYTLKTDEEDTEEPVIQRTTDNVNHPSHYNYGDIEVIDYCDQVCKQYPSDLAPYVFNAIKYLSRSEYKNGKEDVAKAKFYIQRLFDKWDDSHE